MRRPYLLIALFALALQAHVSITPGEVAAGASTRFTVRVPSERDEATVKVRIELPAGLGSPRPMTKPGWTYVIDRDSAGTATAITWSGGKVPAGEFDEFVFTARAPAAPVRVSFLAHQTYASGLVIDWVGPAGSQEPAPTLTVRDSSFVAGAPAPAVTAQAVEEPEASGPDRWSTLAMGLSLLALVVSAAALKRRA